MKLNISKSWYELSLKEQRHFAKLVNHSFLGNDHQLAKKWFEYQEKKNKEKLKPFIKPFIISIILTTIVFMVLCCFVIPKDFLLKHNYVGAYFIYATIWFVLCIILFALIYELFYKSKT